MKEGKRHDGAGSTSARLRKALGCERGEVYKHFPAEVKKVKIKLMGLIPKNFAQNRKSNILTVVSATAEHLLGETQSDSEKKYKLEKGEVQNALRLFFPSKEERLNALSNLLLDNAITGAMIFKEKKKDLTVMQAAIAAGLFTDKFIQLQKAKQNNFASDADVNVSLILQLEKTLARTKEIHGKTIDV